MFKVNNTANGGVLQKKVVLKISQISLQKTYVEGVNMVVSLKEICKIFKSTYLEEHLRRVALALYEVYI